MPKYTLDEINILIADSNIQLRNSLKGVLGHHGFHNISSAANAKELKAAIIEHNPDFILCDIGLKEGKVCDVIRQMRHHLFGQNPFAAVILFIEEPNEETVSMASEAGLDDLQVKPIVAEHIIKRMKYLIEQRKPFVVTTDYIGPDRRKNVRPGTQEIPTFKVPNTVALKAMGQYDLPEVQKEIDASLWSINTQKIERHIFQIGYLIERIVPAYKSDNVNDEIIAMDARLGMVSMDLIKRIKDSEYSHISDIASTLLTVSRSIWKNSQHPSSQDLELLQELSAALSASLNLDDESIDAVSEIRSSVQSNYG